jgi:hypothetical protein
MDWNDEDMPRLLIECGKLVRLHLRAPRDDSSRHPRRRRDAMIEFSKNVSPFAHIAYDPDHPYERLYLLIPPSQRKTLKEHFWDNNPMPARNLNDLAQIAGGKHSRKRDYPDVMCKPLGVLTGVVYYTAKQGDSPQGRRDQPQVSFLVYRQEGPALAFRWKLHFPSPWHHGLRHEPLRFHHFAHDHCDLVPDKLGRKRRSGKRGSPE